MADLMDYEQERQALVLNAQIANARKSLRCLLLSFVKNVTLRFLLRAALLFPALIHACSRQQLRTQNHLTREGMTEFSILFGLLALLVGHFIAADLSGFRICTQTRKPKLRLRK